MSDTRINMPEADQQEPLAPVIVLRTSSDKMELELLLQQPGDNTRAPTMEELQGAIAEKGVIQGINSTALQALCQMPAFNRAMVIARGTPAATGADGYLTYLIRQTKELKPKLLDNGNVDYRDLGLIQNVKKDQPLCEVHPPEKGADGCDIFGKVLEGKYGRDPFDPAGKNTVYNEDKTLLLAAVDGNAEVVRGTINVIDVLRVNGNVDNATGDINFVGDVVINGDVVSGFRVVSEGSVTVKGSVEGATIEAKGDIVVGEGINGMNRGSMLAGANLRCKYIQSCYIKANENIYADSIMYCTMECGGNVELGGKRATLIGGRATIAGRLLGKTIGTDSHVATYITMAATGTKMHQEILDLTASLKEIDAENTKLLQIMARFEDLMKQGRVNDVEQVKAIQNVKDNYLAQLEKRNTVQGNLEKIKQEQLEASRENSYIECKGRVHVGVQITFGPLTMTVQNSFVNSRICIVNNDIGVLNL